MKRRALLIGSQTFGLSGCDADVASMETVLGGKGFDPIQTLTGEDASRDGIVNAAEALIGAAGPDDAVVLYYSGHGGRMQHPDWEARQATGLPAYLQFIVPWDIESSTDEDFRGLLAEELSALQWRLTERTHNVTTILDCCHSGYMARDMMLFPKAISKTFPIDGLLARVSTLPAEHRGGGRDTNPYAVRIVACQPEQSAFERQGHGVLTESLAALLGEGGAGVTWTVIGTLVRDRVVTLAPQQPEIEGPAQRLPFTLDVRQRPQAYPVRLDNGDVTIEAATLLGIAAGDRFRLVGPDGETTVGDARVADLDGDVAILEADSAVPEGAQAVPVETSVPRRPVRVTASGETGAALAELIGKSPRLRVAEADEPVLATIAANGKLVIEDAAGQALRTDGESEPHAAVELVELLATGERMRTLSSGQGAAALDAAVEVELVRHVDEERKPCRLNGERLFEDDRVSLTVRNRSDSVLYIWLFDVGVSSRTTLVTNDAPSGARLEPAGTAGDARTIGGSSGTALDWPADVPRDAGRSELFVLIVADKQQNLRPLESTGEKTRELRTGPVSALDALLDEARIGTREFAPAAGDAPQIRYVVEQVEFFLEPRERPGLDEPAFEIDDRPDPSLRALLPRGGGAPPKKVAVRLVEMTVRKNRALFRAAVRVDALVVTRGAEGGVAYPTTFRFPNIGDQTALPLDNVRLYDGEVNDFLDIALWVNRDDEKGQDLAELFSGELGKPEVKTALTALGGLVVAAPQAALAFGAVAAVATLVTVGAKLVKVATGKEIGTYRTSKLGFEQFGVGRTPPAGRRQAQDVEFAYEVVEIP
ncbi:MAG: caspase family protein [Gaiellaceae bacterium]